MKQFSRYSIFGGSGRARAGSDTETAVGQPLSGSDLEQAYRHLLLENQVLAESNQRLLERVERAERGQSESPAARQLIRAQRDALADRSRQLRELQYSNAILEREHKKLVEMHRVVKEKFARKSAEGAALGRQLETARREVAEAKEQLAEKQRELALLTDRYYQLQTKLDPALSADRVVNIDF